MIATRRTALQAMLGLAGVTLAGCARPSSRVRIGFIVKQAEEQWFQDEWRFAGQAAAQRDFDIIRIGAPDGDRVVTAIDNLWARYAQGFIICTPDPLLGPAIKLRAALDGLKVMSVDDRLIDAHGQPIASIPHVGISARNIGALAGTSALAEARRRGWDMASTGLLRIAFDTLETGRDRTMGARDALLAAGFPAGQVFDAAQRTTDTEGGFTATSPVITRHANIRHWILVGMNDETVLGGVRAAEGAGFGANDLIGVGIGGSGSAVAEFRRAGMTGFWASILLSPRRHGFDTSMAMFDWITKGIRPAAVTFTTGALMARDNYQGLLAKDAA